MIKRLFYRILDPDTQDCFRCDGCGDAAELPTNCRDCLENRAERLILEMDIDFHEEISAVQRAFEGGTDA